MAPQEVVGQVLAWPAADEQRQFLAARAPLLARPEQDEVARLLKAAADQLLRADIHRCLETAEWLLYWAEVTGRPEHRALGLLAQANAQAIGLGDYRQAVALYDEAAGLYRQCNLEVEEATAQIGKIYPLASLGLAEEAIQTARWAMAILEEHEAWFPLARLTGNLGAIYARFNQDTEALTLFERAQHLYERVGEAGRDGWLRTQFNRAIALRNLGDFEASIAAGQQAQRMLAEMGQRVEAARAQQNVAVTYFVLGRYNESLALLDQVHGVFLADDRQRDAIRADLFISDCLLQLRRFGDVLEKTQQGRELFAQLGTAFEVGQFILNEAVAYAGLQRFDEALASLAEARHLFDETGNHTWVAMADLEKAAVLWQQSRHEQSLATAESCAAVFRAQQMPVHEAQALLVAARNARAMARPDAAHALVGRALALAEGRDLPTLTYQVHYLSGALAAGQGDWSTALDEYDRSMAELERLRGRLMVEFRADFLQDKQTVYEEAVRLALDLDRPEKGLEYAERAKSRALLDLLAFRLDLGVEARSPEDEPLVAELLRLRAERDRLYRRWESGEGTSERGISDQEGQAQVQQDVLVLEKEITSLWHRLLIRNADYARDLSLWQVRAEPAQPYLNADTVLVEYFAAGEELVIFLVTADAVTARRLPNPTAQVQTLLKLFHLNLSAVAKVRRTAESASHLERNARGVLRQLYDLLLEPLAEVLRPYSRVIIVPHGPLHYVPFHALHDGEAYLLQRHEVSYLPGSSFLQYCRRPRPSKLSDVSETSESSIRDVVAVGHSFAGRLPYTVEEARAIAALAGGRVLVEDEATRAAIREAAAARVLHLATHGDFRPDNPLFSGLALADGWLTTLDIFNLRLAASLVTLSACQTGRNVVGGGDELLGLMRGFLSAGAASLVATLWPVEDRSTAELMAAFYGKLAEGWPKGAALRFAQRSFAEGQAAAAYRHPYFWAAFFLVGDSGVL